MAGLIWAALASYVSVLVMPSLGAGRDLTLFPLINMALGFLFGWNMAGPRVGMGWLTAIGTAGTTTIVLVLCAVVLHAFAEMVRLAFLQRYQDASLALIDTFRISVRFLRYLYRQDVIFALVLGSVIGGLLTEWVGRRWR